MVTVQKRFFKRFGFFAEGLYLFGRVRVGVGKPLIDKLLRPGFIDIASFGLDVRSEFPALSWSFVPVNAKPFQCVKDKVSGAIDKACLVSVFNA